MFCHDWPLNLRFLRLPLLRLSVHRRTKQSSRTTLAAFSPLAGYHLRLMSDVKLVQTSNTDHLWSPIEHGTVYDLVDPLWICIRERTPPEGRIREESDLRVNR